MRFWYPALFALCLCLAVNAAGQGTVRDHQFVWETSPYLMLSNPAAVSFWDGKLSMAELSFEKHNGGLYGLDQSPDSWELTAGTESYCRISDLIAFHGKLSWADFQGKDMGGPILMNTSYNPVGFYENTLETVGAKKRELYTMGGQIALSPWERWSFGAGVSYQAGDQTKVKDPRFSNVWMDLDVNAGLTWKTADWLTLGASLRWRNTQEMIKGGIYGTTDKQYFISTDKGGFFGSTAELAGDYNYVPDSSPRPMINDWYEAALQFVIGQVFSSELSFAKREGYYGSKSSTTATFFEFGGIKAAYEGLVLIPSGSNLQRIAMSFSYETLGNNENAFRYDTPEGGNTVVVYTGQNHISDRTIMDVALDWRWYGGIENGRPAFMLGVRGGWNSLVQSTIIYPFWRKNSAMQANAELFGRKSFISGRNIFSIDASALYAFGYGTKSRDGAYVQTTSKTLHSFDTYLDRHFEFVTAPRAGASLAFTYTLCASEKVAPYVKLSDTFTTLLAAPEFLDGGTRNVALITLGCTF